MANRSFTVLMEQREDAKQRVQSAQADVQRLVRSTRVAEETLGRAQADLEDFEAAMRLIDPDTLRILEEARE